MPWSPVNDKKYERAVGENETFIKILGDASHPLNREHWSINAVAAITPLGSFAQEDLCLVLRDAWKALRFHHPTIAAYIVDERYVYDVPDGVALEKWASETFQVIEDKTADEVIASTATLCPYATVTYLPQTGEVLLHTQHWRTDGVGVFILLDEFLALVAQSPVDVSSLPWGEETARLAPSIEEAAGISLNPSEEDKRIGQQCVASFGHAVGAVGTVSRAPLETQPGGTRSARLFFTEEETKTVIQACKSQNISVTSAVHASVAAANYALAGPEDQKKHYTSTIRYSFRRFLPKPYSGREYASTIFTTGWMFPVSADSSWTERARAYHDEYHKGLSPDFISAHREYAIGLCNLLRSLPVGAPSPTDVDISSLGVLENFVARERGTAERGIRIGQLSLGLDMVNRQCGCYVWTFRDQLCLNLVYNEAFYDKASMDSFIEIVKDSLLRELTS
ncbi:uncharacterized protein TRUGW13939_05776 [Talaromyces rugulosus]|uniref:Condensation domain-containing protein n=1 Tax=Talaromyces rugulosus TaxID=121627 RepID=A0A7H8QX57_TALRU|nr:uncharacterized protein TRUGW13939_05776 [Talaromyces rugulosus]QKX58649.1 hypothetical protein TRUGW13939_05776 [Talaromyces rugulosus]